MSIEEQDAEKAWSQWPDRVGYNHPEVKFEQKAFTAGWKAALEWRRGMDLNTDDLVADARAAEQQQPLEWRVARKLALIFVSKNVNRAPSELEVESCLLAARAVLEVTNER
jgi:hypothetical protein